MPSRSSVGLTGRSVAAAIGLAISCGSLGCGGSAPDPAPRAQRQIQVDSALRAVVLKAPAALRTSVRFVDPYTVVRAPFEPSRTAMVVLGSTYLPWDEDGDGVSQTRNVAFDRALLVGREDGPRNLRALEDGSDIAVHRAPSQVLDLLSNSLSFVLEQSGTAGVPDRLHEREFATATQALDAARAGTVAAASVTRSSFIQDGRGLQRVTTDVSFIGRLSYFMGTLRATSESRGLRKWLLGPEGTSALRAAGFRAPPSDDPDVVL